MKNRRKTAIAVRADWDEAGKLRWALYERSTNTVLTYFRDKPKRGCIAGRRQLSRALDAAQIES